MGRRAAAIAPSRTMTMEITQARTGRSMKKRASTAGLHGRKSEVGSQKSAVRGRKSEVRGQKSEVRGQTWGWQSDAVPRSQFPTSDFRPLTADFRPLTSDFRPLTSDFRPLTSARHGRELRLDGYAWPNQLQTVDDHSLSRLQAVFDCPQPVVQRSSPNGEG